MAEVRRGDQRCVADRYGPPPRARRTSAKPPVANVATTSAIMRPENSDAVLGRGDTVPAKGTRDVGAGSVRRAWRVRAESDVRAAAECAPDALGVDPRPPDPPDEPDAPAPPPRSAATSAGGRCLASAGVPGSASPPPVADGMSSQYWFCALTVAFEQGLPGCVAAAAGTAPTSTAPAASARQSSAFRVLINTAPGAC
jgi:hypothetical protein